MCAPGKPCSAGAGVGGVPLLQQPARALRDPKQQYAKHERRHRRRRQFPAPTLRPGQQAADDEVAAVGGEDSEHDIELKQADQSAAAPGGGDLGNIDGGQDRGATDGQPGDEAEGDEGGKVGGQRAADGRHDIEDAYQP